MLPSRRKLDWSHSHQTVWILFTILSRRNDRLDIPRFFYVLFSLLHGSGREEDGILLDREREQADEDDAFWAWIHSGRNYIMTI